MASRQKRSSLHLERGAWRLEARATAGILLVLILLGLLGWLCLNQASQVSTARHRLREKEMELVRLQRQNAESLAEIAEMLSVSRLENIALGLGYVPAEKLRYLDVPGYPSDGVSGRGLAAAPRLDENADIASEAPRDKPLGVARWWEKVISQFVTWAGTQP